jgi:virulence-associated protein VagC
MDERSARPGPFMTDPDRPAEPAPPTRPEPVVDGEATVYRLYDVGYEIQLGAALGLLAQHGAQRAGPVRGEAQALQIKNPPVTVALGTETLQLGGDSCPVHFSTRIFDFGVVSLRARVQATPGLSWSRYSEFGNKVDVGMDWSTLLNRRLQQLLEDIAPAILRPAVSPVTEDYVVFRIHRLMSGGAAMASALLTDDDIVPLLLNERRSLSQAARRELLPHRFSYYADDLAILTWDNALVLEPSPGNSDIEFVLEFANAQLLELRIYDALLDQEIPRMLERVARVRTHPGLLFRNYARTLAGLHTLVADGTEVVERVENAFKVTDDVYLARVYSAALEIFRGREWRKGIDRKLEIIEGTYAMLNGESQAARAEALEVVIVILIAVEIVMGLLRR